VRQGCFADAGDAFQQQVSARKDRNQRQADDILFAANDGA